MSLIVKKDKRPVREAVGEGDALARQQRELKSEIDQLSKYLETAPELARKAQDEAARTLPPMDDLKDRRREKTFYERYGRGEIKNERRKQQLSGFLMFLLITASAAMGYWVYQIIQRAFV